MATTPLVADCLTDLARNHVFARVPIASLVSVSIAATCGSAYSRRGASTLRRPIRRGEAVSRDLPSPVRALPEDEELLACFGSRGACRVDRDGSCRVGSS